MKNLAGQKEEEAGFTWRGKLRWAVLSLAALLLLMVAAPAEAVEEGVETASAAPCKGLKASKDMDELVYQIYTNLDSDCLFRMNPKELADIWRIPRVMRGNRSAGKSYERPSSSEEFPDNLMIDVVADASEDHPDIIKAFRIASHTYSAPTVPFFPNNRNPKSLPEPLICGYTLQHLVWPNSDETRVMYLSNVVGEDREFHSVTVLNGKFPMDLVNCHYQSEK